MKFISSKFYLLSILIILTHIYKHFFTHTYFKNIQAILLKLLYQTPPKSLNYFIKVSHRPEVKLFDQKVWKLEVGTPLFFIIYKIVKKNRKMQVEKQDIYQLL